MKKNIKKNQKEEIQDDQTINDLNKDFVNFKSRRRHYIFYNAFILTISLVVILAALFSFYVLFNNRRSQIYKNSFNDADKPIVTKSDDCMTISIPHNNYFVMRENKFVVPATKSSPSYSGFYLDEDHLLNFYQQYFLRDMFHGPEISNLKSISIDTQSYNPGNDAVGFYIPYAETINLNPSATFLIYGLSGMDQKDRENDLKYVMQHEYLHHMVNTYYKTYDYDNSSNVLTSSNYDNIASNGKALKMENVRSEDWNKSIMTNYFKDRHYDSSSDIVADKTKTYYDSLSTLVDKYKRFPTATDLQSQLNNVQSPTEPKEFMGSSLMNMFNSTNKPYYDVNDDQMNQHLSTFINNHQNDYQLSLNSNYYPKSGTNYQWSGVGYYLNYDEVLVRDYCQMLLNNPLITDGKPSEIYAGQAGIVNGYYEDYAIRYNYLSSLYNYTGNNDANSDTYKTYGNLLTAMNYGKTVSYLNRNDNNYSFGGYSDQKYDWVVFDNSNDSTPASYSHYAKLTYSPFFNNLNMKDSLGASDKTVTPLSAIDNNDKKMFFNNTNHYAYQTSTFASGENSQYLYFIKNTTGKSSPNGDDQIERVKLDANNWNGNSNLIFNGNGSWYNDNKIYQNNDTGMQFELKSKDNLLYLKV